MSIYQPSFFDEADRLAKLSKLKDPLEALLQHIDFQIFRPQLAEVFYKEKKSAAGRKAYDVVLMFKILILQRLYNLSDEQAEFQINDRHSFQRFLGLHLGCTVPDFSTVWLFREALTVAEAIKPLFDTYGAILEKQGVITKAGTIVDASFVEVPRQRNTREENTSNRHSGLEQRFHLRHFLGGDFSSFALHFGGAHSNWLRLGRKCSTKFSLEVDAPLFGQSSARIKSRDALLSLSERGSEIVAFAQQSRE